MNPDRQYYLPLQWNYPVLLKNINLEKQDNHVDFDKSGIYLITRQFTPSAREETIYIGKTARTFRYRLWEHLNRDFSNWTTAHGIIRVRIAVVSIPNGMSQEVYDKTYLEDIESALIYEQCPRYNTDKKSSYHCSYDLHLLNKNIRADLLPHDICNRKHRKE